MAPIVGCDIHTHTQHKMASNEYRINWLPARFHGALVLRLRQADLPLEQLPLLLPVPWVLFIGKVLMEYLIHAPA